MPKKKKVKEEPLLARAKKVGLSDEQIKKFTDDKSLKAYLDRISPVTNPDAKPKKAEVPKPKPKPKVEIPNPVIIEMEPEKVREEIQDILVRVQRTNVRYGSPGIARAKKVVIYDVNTRETKAFYEIEVRSNNELD